MIDADQISRDLVEPGQPALGEIRDRFGPTVIQSDGRLDRAALGAVVFDDSEALSALNAILHPRVAERTAERVASAPEDAIVVYDVPLLVENDLAEGWNAIVVVQADREIRLERLQANRSMSGDHALARMSSQATDEDRRKVADYVIDNSGSVAQLRSAVDRVWLALQDG